MSKTHELPNRNEVKLEDTWDLTSIFESSQRSHV